MKIIGITGGTGAGKTSALEVLAAMGAEIIDCDEVYHGLLETDGAMRQELFAAFGDVLTGGRIDRKKLGRAVFGSAEKLEQLNRITHKYVYKAVRDRLARAEREGRSAVAIDAIALIESGIAALCDEVVGVTAPEAARVRRLMEREGISEEYALLRIRAQKSEAWFRENCAHILENNGDMSDFTKTCREFFTSLLQKQTEARAMNIFERIESNVRSYSRSFPVVFTRAKMSKMYDRDGKEYLDFFDGAGALNYGHNNDFIKQRIVEYIESDGISHALDMFTEAKEAFFICFEEKILKPRGLNYKLMSCAPTGTNGVEAALKLARKATGRSGIFALTGSFHGMTLGSLAVTSGKTVRRGAGEPLSGVTFVPHPNSFAGDSIAYIENLITDEYSGVEKPAAIILETVQAEGGVIVAGEQWLRDLRALCDRQGVLMIVDDIQVGCGRTGKFFSFERAGIVPDMVVLSKSISGYGLPMSLLLLKPELDVFNPGEHNGTFRGNQMAFVGAKAAIEYRELVNLEAKTEKNAAIIEQFVDTRILPLNDKLVRRGLGMIQGVDFRFAQGERDIAGEVAHACFRNGLIIERAGPNDCVLKIMPALTIEEDELHRGLEIIEQAVREAFGKK